ncbi:MAG: folate-binding protein YgfZ [Gammaproteobacteria bacterium]|nr:folate-binding protein YgfZ [Gammaproteobacteria bacterium]
MLRYCTLQDHVCVEAAGTDAVEFLRAQLTNDPPAEHGAFATAAWCDARGRVRALFHVLRAGDERCVLVTERETADAVLKAMRMYVLRAKVELRAVEEWRVAAIVGDAGDVAAWAKQRVGPDRAHRLQVGAGLAYAVGPAPAVERAVGGLKKTEAQQIELDAIRLGLPRVRGAAMLQYVPQMLNLDRIGAVSFTKGCYPGQEVVARLHHRGSVKRRMQRFSFEHDGANALPGAGDAIVVGNDDSSEGSGHSDAVGEVIRSASVDAHGELLAVVQLDVLGSPLRLDGGARALLRHEPLPYDH